MELGRMLLNDTPAHNRKLMALVVKVEERELLQVRITVSVYFGKK
jgi:hypothetical protein